MLDLVNEICPTKILLANPGADLTAYQRMFRLNEREVEAVLRFDSEAPVSVKTAQRSKVLNVNLDPRAYWQYTNSPYDNERRREAIEHTGSKKAYKFWPPRPGKGGSN